LQNRKKACYNPGNQKNSKTEKERNTYFTEYIFIYDFQVLNFFGQTFYSLDI